jgi:hypothetical protein
MGRSYDHLSQERRQNFLTRPRRHPRDPGAERIEPLVDPLIAALVRLLKIAGTPDIGLNSH